ncbi:hypothetical protein Ddc_07443 [Ditylenchus destructor]|nr:hypothetical protein Ddc_07443 [Ditylenchus destructor]
MNHVGCVGDKAALEVAYQPDEQRRYSRVDAIHKLTLKKRFRNVRGSRKALFMLKNETMPKVRKSRPITIWVPYLRQKRIFTVKFSKHGCSLPERNINFAKTTYFDMDARVRDDLHRMILDNNF